MIYKGYLGYSCGYAYRHEAAVHLFYFDAFAADGGAPAAVIRHAEYHQLIAVVAAYGSKSVLVYAEPGNARVDARLRVDFELIQRGYLYHAFFKRLEDIRVLFRLLLRQDNGAHHQLIAGADALELILCYIGVIREAHGQRIVGFVDIIPAAGVHVFVYLELFQSVVALALLHILGHHDILHACQRAQRVPVGIRGGIYRALDVQHIVKLERGAWDYAGEAFQRAHVPQHIDVVYFVKSLHAVEIHVLDVHISGNRLVVVADVWPEYSSVTYEIVPKRHAADDGDNGGLPYETIERKFLSGIKHKAEQYKECHRN